MPELRQADERGPGSDTVRRSSADLATAPATCRPGSAAPNADRCDEEELFRRHPILTAILALIVLIIIVAAAAGGSSNKKPSANGNSSSPSKPSKPAMPQSEKDARAWVNKLGADSNRVAANVGLVQLQVGIARKESFGRGRRQAGAGRATVSRQPRRKSATTSRTTMTADPSATLSYPPSLARTT